MAFAFDHLVVIVSDLTRAIGAFEAAGFSVTPGGRHESPPTHNALIPFEHGGYIELLAFRGSADADAAREAWKAGTADATVVEKRFLPRLLRGEGIADVALHGFHAHGRAGMGGGIAWSGRLAMTRRRADGVRIEWELAFPDRDDLPFVIQDLTPRHLRIPSDPDDAMHPNGALGVERVTFRSRRPDEAAHAWCDAFGAEPVAEVTSAPTVQLASARFAFVAGDREGVSAVTIRGIGAVTEALRALGIDAAVR